MSYGDHWLLNRISTHLMAFEGDSTSKTDPDHSASSLLTMTSTAKSVFYYSFYMMGMGLGLLFIPNLILGIFGFAPTNDIWIRILGLFAFCAGMLYFYCGRTNQTGFLRISVTERIVFFLGMVGIVLFLRVNPLLIAIGSVDLFGAIWTALALRKTN